MKILTSRANPLAKTLRRLAREGDPGGRTVFVEGVRLLEEALASPGIRLETLAATEEAAGRPREKALVDRSREAGARIVSVSRELLAWISPLPSPPGIAGIVDLGEEDRETPLGEGDGPVLVLDGVQDPANVGMILRAAEAAGVSSVWLTAGSVDRTNPKLLRASAGSLFRLKPSRIPTGAVKRFRAAGRRIIAAVAPPGRGEPLERVSLREPFVLVLGAEGQGVSPAWEKEADVRLTLSLEGGVESLNVAVIAAVILFEGRRQRRERAETGKR